MIDLIDLKIYRTSYYGYLWFIKFINQLFTLPMTTKEGLCRLAAPFSWPFVAIQCRIMQIINQPRTIVIKLTSVDGRHGFVCICNLRFCFKKNAMKQEYTIRYDDHEPWHPISWRGLCTRSHPAWWFQARRCSTSSRHGRSVLWWSLLKGTPSAAVDVFKK